MIKLGGADKTSIDFIARTRLFVAPGIADQDRVRRFLVERYFENGAALFGRHTPEEMQDFRDVAGVNWSDEETHLVIQYFVQRVRHYAHLESLAAAGFDEASVVSNGDGCGREGERINIGQMIRRLHAEIDLPATEYAQNIYGRRSTLPPFVANCTCRLSGYFA